MELQKAIIDCRPFHYQGHQAYIFDEGFDKGAQWKEQQHEAEMKEIDELLDIANILVGSPDVDFRLRVRLRNAIIKLKKP